MPRAGHLHMEPSPMSSAGRFVNSVERVGKAAVQVGGALNTAYQVGKGFAYAARYAAPLLGLL